MALTDLQVRKQLNMFNAFDADKDGVLEMSDLMAIARRIAAETGLSQGSAEHDQIVKRWAGFWTYLSTFCDTDHNNLVSQREWLAMHESLSEQAKNDAGAFYFQVLDMDHDGQIMLDEFRKLYRITGVGEAFADEAFPRFDQNGDGYVSADEFNQLVAEYHGTDPNAAGNWLFGRV